MTHFAILQETLADAQPSSASATTFIGTAIGIAIAWIFFALCWSSVAKKTGEEERAWWAWIPGLQQALVLKMARRPMWWLFLMLIPGIQFFVWLIACLGVANTRRKGAITGALAALFPVVGLPMMAVGD